MHQEYVLGIDGGGTYTRAAVADLEGNVLGYSVKEGAHPGKNHHPEANVKQAIQEALQKAGATYGQIRYLVAGLAGVDNVEDLPEANKLIEMTGIECGNSLVNDAFIAQYGTFVGRPGIVAVGGTGVIVLGKDEKDRIITNYDFHHDSESGARFLAYSALYELISYEVPDDDQSLVEAVMDYWEVSDVKELRELVASGFCDDKIDAKKKLSRMGELVTAAAAGGSRIAIIACRELANVLITGIGLVASRFQGDEVPLALEGSVAKNPVIRDLVLEGLRTGTSVKRYQVEPSPLPPVLGAILYAYQQIGIDITPQKLGNLRSMGKLEGY